MKHSYQIGEWIVTTDAEGGPFGIEKSEFHPGHEAGHMSCCVDGYFIVWKGPGLGLHAGMTEDAARRLAYCMNEAFLLGRAIERVAPTFVASSPDTVASKRRGDGTA